MTPPHSLKARLARLELTIGSWITLAHPAVAEIFARAGFDWLAVDLEHSVITIREAEELIRVVALHGVAPLARLTSNDADQIKRVMDAGAHGVIVPDVRTAADASLAVDAVHYPPRGGRGVGLARAQGYGAAFQDYRRWLEGNGVVVVMLESAEAVENADQVIGAPGVDGYLVGPYDLSASLGVPGRLDHPKVSAALKRIREAGRLAGKPGGLHVVEPSAAQLKRRVKEGFRLIAYSLDTRMLDVAARAGLAAVRRTR